MPPTVCASGIDPAQCSAAGSVSMPICPLFRPRVISMNPVSAAGEKPAPAPAIAPAQPACASTSSRNGLPSSRPTPRPRLPANKAAARHGDGARAGPLLRQELRAGRPTSAAATIGMRRPPGDRNDGSARGDGLSNHRRPVLHEIGRPERTSPGSRWPAGAVQASGSSVSSRCRWQDRRRPKTTQPAWARGRPRRRAPRSGRSCRPVRTGRLARTAAG